MTPDPIGRRPKYTLRRSLAFAIDACLHVAVAVGAFAVVNAVPDVKPTVAVIAIPITFVVVSAFHRIVVQAAIGTTVGKLIVGLRMARFDGTEPTLGFTTSWWLRGAIAAALEAASSGGWTLDEFPPVVRRNGK